MKSLLINRYFFIAHMLKIRLARVGKRKKPVYRLIVSENTKDTYGRFLEILGHYNPFTKVIEVNKDRILYWISKGAQPSPTAHNLLVDQNVIQADKVKASKSKKKKAEATPEAKPKETKESTETVPVETKTQKPTEAKTKESTAEKKPTEELKPEGKVEEKKEEPAPDAKPEKKIEAPKAEEPKPEAPKA